MIPFPRMLANSSLTSWEQFGTPSVLIRDVFTRTVREFGLFHRSRQALQIALNDRYIVVSFIRLLPSLVLLGFSRSRNTEPLRFKDVGDAVKEALGLFSYLWRTKACPKSAEAGSDGERVSVHEWTYVYL